MADLAYSPGRPERNDRRNDFDGLRTGGGREHRARDSPTTQLRIPVMGGTIVERHGVFHLSTEKTEAWATLHLLVQPTQGAWWLSCGMVAKRVICLAPGFPPLPRGEQHATFPPGQSLKLNGRFIG
jgi:hypothetical protein